MQKIIDLVAHLVTAEKLISGTFSRPKQKKATVTKIQVRPIEIKQTNLYQFTHHLKSKVLHHNLPPEAAQREIIAILQEQFIEGQFHTTDADYHIFANAGGRVKILTRKATKTQLSTAHDRQKNYIIPLHKPNAFLIQLGIMNQEGRVLPSRMHKFKQINRFLEMVADVADNLPANQELNIIDFGYGKSYLTFALYDYLHLQRQLDVRITGLDLKTSVIKNCNSIAQDLGWSPRLHFKTGDIKDHYSQERVHMVVSLHACDTATDLAIAKAVAWKSKIILAVPCCQHELIPKINNTAMGPLLKHGIMRERITALITDSLRAQALEVMGYNVQVLEFIETEDTAKNLLIRAILKNKPSPLQDAQAEYRLFKEQWLQETPFIETVLPFLSEEQPRDPA